MTERARVPPELEFAEDSEYDPARDRRLQRTRLTAWVVIIAMVLAGGGAIVLSLFTN